MAKLQSGAIVKQYYYDAAGEMIEATDGRGSVLRAEIYAGGRHLATWVPVSGGTTDFTYADELGTERVRTDSSGAVCQTLASLPFGDGESASGSCSPTPNFFTGLERDAESGLDHTLNRQLSSNLGRWMTPDPGGVKVVSLSDPQSWDMYVYVTDNPTTLDDPTGLGPNGAYNLEAGEWSDTPMGINSGSDTMLGIYVDSPDSYLSLSELLPVRVVEEASPDPVPAQNQYNPMKSGPEDPTNLGHPLSQNKAFKKESDKAWMATTNGQGRSGLAEGGFVVQYENGKMTFVEFKTSMNSSGAANELHFSVDTRVDIAILHTHGNNADPTPSPGDRSPSTKVPDFVRSQHALYVVMPGTATGNPPLNQYIELPQQ